MGKALQIAGKEPSIVANINASNRAMPRPISASIFNQSVQLDSERKVQFPGDKQLVRISIAKKDLDINDNEVVTLAVRGFDHKLYDKLGLLLKPNFQSEKQTNYVFNLDKVAAINLYLETSKLAGSPLVKSKSVFIELRLYVTHLYFDAQTFEEDDEAHFKFSEDAKKVWIAPLGFLSNLAKVERLFIASLPENEPTVKELQAELKAIGMESVLEKIPADVCKGDAWLQDQYQEAYCEDDRGNTLRVVWHLPRLRSETADADRPNLSTFVDHYFPSSDIGLVNDFWKRSFTVTTKQQTRSITFRDTFLISLTFRLVEKYWDSSMAFFRLINSANAKVAPPTDIWEQIQQAGMLIFSVGIEYKKFENKSAELDNRLDFLVDMLKEIQKRFTTIFSDSAEVKIVRKDRTAVVEGTVDSTEIRRLHREFDLLHDSVNYGGNIEIAPPAGPGLSGRPVIGNSSSRPMDQAVLDFLGGQAGGNPIEIDTSWLKVGHVDELISFVPTPATVNKWAILQNSTTVAFAILMEAVRFYFQDDTLDIDKTDWSTINGPSGYLGDENKDRFVSTLLRGKYWEFQFDRTEAAIPQIMPQRIYLANQSSLFTGAPDVKFDVFAAAISPLEILRLEQRFRMNRDVEKLLDELTAQLRKELDNPDIIYLPAIFDIPEGNMTESFCPNLVNLQVVGSHLMMPRPFGPRMKAADAVTVLKKVLDPGMHSLVSTSFIKKMRLDSYTLNIQNFPETDYHQQIPLSGIKQHSFVDTPNDFAARLLEANRTDFTSVESDPYLKPGWHKLTIPEKTVDLFEFYTTIVLSQVGATVHWIDTWYYHIRHGGLHCGTNTLRKV